MLKLAPAPDCSTTEMEMLKSLGRGRALDEKSTEAWEEASDLKGVGDRTRRGRMKEWKGKERKGEERKGKEMNGEGRGCGCGCECCGGLYGPPSKPTLRP